MTSPPVPQLKHLLRPLAEYFVDPTIEDVAFNEPGKAWLQHHGRWDSVNVPLTFDDLEEIAFLAGSLRHQDVDDRMPLCSTDLPDGERLQICLPPVAQAGKIILSIRVHEQRVAPIKEVANRYRTENWNKFSRQRGGRDLKPVQTAYQSGDFDRFLNACVDARLNVLVAGATGAGKTTLSKTIISAISPKRRIGTIEDTIELIVDQPNVFRLLYSKGDLSGTGVTAEHLVEAGMRLRPDIFLLQELRDESAWSYLTAVCAGHPGSITTIHGRDPADALRRLSLLVKSCEAGRALDREDILTTITSAIDVVIPLEKDDDVKPRVHNVWVAGNPNAPSVAELLQAV